MMYLGVCGCVFVSLCLYEYFYVSVSVCPCSCVCSFKPLCLCAVGALVRGWLMSECGGARMRDCGGAWVRWVTMSVWECAHRDICVCVCACTHTCVDISPVPAKEQIKTIDLAQLKYWSFKSTESDYCQKVFTRFFIRIFTRTLLYFMTSNAWLVISRACMIHTAIWVGEGGASLQGLLHARRAYPGPMASRLVCALALIQSFVCYPLVPSVFFAGHESVKSD
jgi:hypothetical protein